MNRLLSLKIPGPDGTATEIQAPEGIPTGSSSLPKIIAWGIDLMLIAIVLLAFGFILWGGFNWITSEGDKTKVETARKTIMFAVIGLIIAFLAFFVIQVLGGLFGFNLLEVSFGK